MMKLVTTVTLSFALLASGLQAAPRFEEMDYGRFLSHTFNDAGGKSTLQNQAGCATDKGIAIKLGSGGDTGAMLFDTDLLRMSGGWTGGFAKLRGVVFEGGHGPNPQPADGAKIFFQNGRAPGWSKGDDFADPRALPTGPGAAKIPFGPLPSEWAKYKGLYLHEDHVVLAYTVGKAAVLELPGLEKAGEQSLLTRTFQVLTPGAASKLRVADGAEGASTVVENNVAIMSDDAKTPDSRLVIFVQGAPNGAAWETGANGSVLLKLPAFTGKESFKVVYWKTTAAELGKVREIAGAVAKPINLVALTKGGAARWTAEITTQGKVGAADAGVAYVIDDIAVPLDNPYKAWMRIAGMDFFKDGRAAVSTWSGDVWTVSGIGENLDRLQWKRYATGLFQALGLKIVDDKVYVLGRDQITRLHDLNNDGEADLYENFNNDVQTTPGFHEFALDLHTDPQGNFYFAKGGPVNPGGRGWGPLSDHNGCVLKVSKDGSKLEVFATGVRAPNGMCVGPNGEVTVGDNQGTWVPACYVSVVKPGGFVSVTDLSHKDPLPTDYNRHICFFPMDVDNSSGCQVWVTSDKWGPMKGRLLHLSYGKSSLLATMTETVDGTIQGGAFKMPVQFGSGICRARFNPADGQLYVAGLRGWQTNATKDGTLQRVRYTGQEACLPASLRVTDRGIHIGFSAPLDAQSAGDVQNYSVDQWNYRWTKDYGSPDFKVSDPAAKGRDSVEIKSAKLSADKKSVFLEAPGLQPVMQMQIKMNIKGENGKAVPDKITNTINAVGKEGGATAAVR